jgi:hypothetical protein
MSPLSKYIQRARSVDVGRVLRNRVLLFAINRYVGYGLQFLRGMLVAKLLGPYHFGVWGFLMLVRQYLLYTSLGLEYAVSVELATGSTAGDDQQEEIIRVALSSVITIAGFLILCGTVVQALGVPSFEKYSFSQYALALVAVVGLTHIRQVLTNVHRVYGNLIRIGAGELLTAALPLLASETKSWFLLC